MADRAVYKSTAAEYLDDLFGGTPDELRAAYEGALELLDSIGDAPLTEAVSRLVDDGELPPESIENSDKGWRAGQRVDRVIRVGFTEAMQLALAGDEPRPIETLWVTGASDDFELHICEGKRSIIVTFFIPLERSYGSRHANARSWVVRVDDDADGDDGDVPVAMIQTSGSEPSSATAS
jgi:hypothetical protein